MKISLVYKLNLFKYNKNLKKNPNKEIINLI
jgi:hypothetical protein